MSLISFAPSTSGCEARICSTSVEPERGILTIRMASFPSSSIDGRWRLVREHAQDRLDTSVLARCIPLHPAPSRSIGARIHFESLRVVTLALQGLRKSEAEQLAIAVRQILPGQSALQRSASATSKRTTLRFENPNHPSALAESRRSTSRNPATAASTLPRLAWARASERSSRYVRRVELERASQSGEGLSVCAWRPSASPRLNHADVAAGSSLQAWRKCVRASSASPQLEQGYAEPESQIGILGAHRQDPAEALDRLGCCRGAGPPCPAAGLRPAHPAPMSARSSGTVPQLKLLLPHSLRALASRRAATDESGRRTAPCADNHVVMGWRANRHATRPAGSSQETAGREPGGRGLPESVKNRRNRIGHCAAA